MLVPIFYFDNDGFFAYEGKAQQTKGGSVLMPQNATQVAPDQKKLSDHFAHWNEDGKRWEYFKKPATAADFVGIKVSHKSQTVHDQELRQIIQDVTKDSTDYRLVRGSEEEGLWWGVEEIPEKTQDEKDLEQAKSDEQKALSYLRSTDYVAVKIAEGVATKEEYADVLEKRAAAREEINALRASQQTLKAKIEEAKA